MSSINIHSSSANFKKMVIWDEAMKKEDREKKVDSLRKVAILVIEDEEDLSNLLSDVLTHEGHEVETAPNGIQGIEVFEKKEFDMVFTDLGMPGISGWQVAEKVKSINGRVPVALITGWATELNQSEMKDSCLDILINKPFEIKQIINLVQEGMILRERFNKV